MAKPAETRSMDIPVLGDLPDLARLLIETVPESALDVDTVVLWHAFEGTDLARVLDEPLAAALLANGCEFLFFNAGEVVAIGREFKRPPFAWPSLDDIPESLMDVLLKLDSCGWSLDRYRAG